MSVGYAEAEPMAYQEQTKTKKKVKSNFIAKWLLNKLKEQAKQEENMNYGAQLTSPKGLAIERQSPSIDQPDRAIQFTVYTANGGRVVETRRYDRKTDRNSNGLYVITSDQDFGKEIDKIITMEFLK